MDTEQIKREVQFRADRSSGSGGQHVNKVSTKVTLTFYPATSLAFAPEAQQLLHDRLDEQLSADGGLRVSAQSSRSQARNREEAWQKLLTILAKAIEPPPPPRKRLKRNVNTPELRRKRQQQAAKKASRRKLRPHDIRLNED